MIMNDNFVLACSCDDESLIKYIFNRDMINRIFNINFDNKEFLSNMIHCVMYYNRTNIMKYILSNGFQDMYPNLSLEKIYRNIKNDG